ncbi:MAG: hypothetical protein JST89_20480 [Cyanobacteria bacterium SZAS-4]|nr:hypothetical protein [Cyanobacteria bacterium SZAS-4]
MAVGKPRSAPPKARSSSGKRDTVLHREQWNTESTKFIQQTSRPLMREDLLTRTRVFPVIVGIWDLGSRIGFLLNLLDKLNKAQETIQFRQVYASIPAGLISKPARLREWMKDEKQMLSEEDLDTLDDNIIANDYFQRAEVIRQTLGLSVLCGIVPSMIAGQDDSGIYWNHFSSESDSGRELIVSTYEIREFADKAGKPVEAAVAGMMVAQLMVALNEKVGFHRESRQCFFDYNDQRTTIVDCIKACQVDEQCLNLLEPRYRSSMEALVKTISKYRRVIQK